MGLTFCTRALFMFVFQDLGACSAELLITEILQHESRRSSAAWIKNHYL